MVSSNSLQHPRSPFSYAANMSDSVSVINIGNWIGSKCKKSSPTGPAPMALRSMLLCCIGNGHGVNQVPIFLPMMFSIFWLLFPFSLDSIQPLTVISILAKSFDLAISCLENAIAKCSSALSISLVCRHKIPIRFERSVFEKASSSKAVVWLEWCSREVIVVRNHRKLVLVVASEPQNVTNEIRCY